MNDSTRSNQSDASKAPPRLLQLMTARAPRDDLAAYSPDALAASARLAQAALLRHRKGASVVAVDTDPAIVRRGRPMTAITVVNDNMPFLFDSLVAEISESVGEAALVMHPILSVRHDDEGVAALLGEAGKSAADRVSLIHIHVARVDETTRQGLGERIEQLLRQVRATVADWKPMLARLDRAIAELRDRPPVLGPAAVSEAVAFLEWLRDDNFTFLGMREFAYSGDADTGGLERDEAPGLGILADPQVRVLRRGDEPVTATPEIRAFLHGPEPLLVTKANARSVVHRRSYMDYVGVKTFDAAGNLVGELRIVGLFTSTAYTRSVMSIPFIRSKARAVIEQSGFDPADHSGKALLNVLESYPRDELFQIGVPTLGEHAAAILALGERPRVRVLHRIDQFDRFVSVLVFVPRDRYDSHVRVEIGNYLREVFDGRLSAFYPAFPEGPLARVHFIIGRSQGSTPRIDAETLEEGARRIVRTWDDALREAVADSGADSTLAALARRFPESYRNSFAPETALDDAARMAGIGTRRPIAIDFWRERGEGASHASLKIYHLDEPVALSRRVPLLENMGFRVISERTFEIGRAPAGAQEQLPAGAVFLHDMEIESATGDPIDLADGGALLESVFLSVWHGESDNDGYNGLALVAGLSVPQISVLRAYGRYLQQAGIPQGQDFVAGVLARHPKIAGELFDLFDCRLNPSRSGAGAEIRAAIEAALEDVPSLDEDTIVRRFLDMIEATLRTNHYAAGEGVSLALKLDPGLIQGLPEPRPWRELFVYGPQVEGVHLRFGPVARGGLRWSDRALDYRTEVLGLVKAQQVKNAVIVPVGAKGGFVPKRLPAGGSREEVFEAGKAAYVNFISSLLSVTDNIEGDEVAPPRDVRRLDGDDPYFVVAADKGTATFSDTANAISQDHDFWLDDAFASGGSAGYDHKKMGITARGAWEAVKRHFREMDRDIQSQEFTVAGVGDMSGDVFGNGMLLSRHIRLVAAFDHRDIFIDPEPDAAGAFAERQRLFDLPRSSWQDYDKSLLSKGGMIVSRNQKSILLSHEAASLLGLAGGAHPPADIISAILKAPVDLLWFGGIGTYVRGPDEPQAEVGDRANDAIRVTGQELRAKVVGEGANLGMTQRARVAYGLRGGRCNSDAIDNSAGVNSSDVEVNIKIALARPLRAGSLQREARDRLLTEMTDEVAALVLDTNVQQTLAISLIERRGMSDLSDQSRLMQSLEARGRLDRAVENLPGADILAERTERGQPLTRAEIAVLVAYAKIDLFDALVESGLPDEAHFDATLLAYFPAQMQSRYADEIRGHRLRREIVATELANDVVNRVGPTFISRLQEITGCPPAEIVAAYATVRDGFAIAELWDEVAALDGRIEGAVQLALFERLAALLRDLTAWQLANESGPAGIDAGVAALRDAREALAGELPVLLSSDDAGFMEADAAALVEKGVPGEIANALARLPAARLVPEIALAARLAGADMEVAAKALVAAGEAFHIGQLDRASVAMEPADHYEGLALARAGTMIHGARRAIAVRALKESGGNFQSWLEGAGARMDRARARLSALAESGDPSVARLTVAAGILQDLAS